MARKPDKADVPVVKPSRPGLPPNKADVPVVKPARPGIITTPAIRPPSPMPLRPGTPMPSKPGQISTMPVGPIKPFNPSMGAKQAAIEEMRKRKRP